METKHLLVGLLVVALLVVSDASAEVYKIQPFCTKIL